MTMLSLIFLLADGPKIRARGERHASPTGCPHDHQADPRVAPRLLGVTIVAAFNAVVVTLGAIVLGIPLAGTIGVVTFFAAYVPYLGPGRPGRSPFCSRLGAPAPTRPSA